MLLTARQQDILERAVFEYIDRAQPISSSWLEAKYDLSVSPATIRNELSLLEEQGYLEQPHTSSGRVPTDQGYRFFVDELLGKGMLQDREEEQEFEPYPQDYVEFAQVVGRNLAEASSSLTVVYVPQKSLFWKEGWEGVLRAPEFAGRDQIGSFLKFLVDVERGFRDFHAQEILEIYIGQENPFSKEKDFSIMIAAYSFPKKQKGLLALVGPKRMAYQKNIWLLNSLRRIFA